MCNPKIMLLDEPTKGIQFSRIAKEINIKNPKVVAKSISHLRLSVFICGLLSNKISRIAILRLMRYKVNLLRKKIEGKSVAH